MSPLKIAKAYLRQLTAKKLINRFINPAFRSIKISEKFYRSHSLLQNRALTIDKNFQLINIIPPFGSARLKKINRFPPRKNPTAEPITLN